MTTKTDEQQRAAFMDWLTKHCDYDDLNKSEVALALDAWQAAIALGRQQRGEPVGLQAVAEKMYKALNEELAAYDPPIHHVRAAVQAYQDWVNFTAPQPAEPVKVPSDETLLNLLSECGAMTTMNGVNAIRLALFHYGQPAQPAHTLGGSKEEYTRVFNMGRDSAQPAASAEPINRNVREAIHGLQGSIAVGSDGEWVSIRRDARDMAIQRLRDLSDDCAHMYESYRLATERAAPVAAQPSVPEGWALVPVEPTPEMLKAFHNGFLAELHLNDKRRTMTAEEAGLRAMLKVAPTPPADGQAQQEGK